MMKDQKLFLCALLLGAASCSNLDGGDARDGAFKRGVEALQKGQVRTARVEFMNAIKADPDNGKIRLYQAQAYLALDDGIAAQAEIDRARKLGIPVDETRHLMAHALLLQNSAERALDELQGVPQKHAAYASRIRAQAHHQLGDLKAAATEFEQAIALSPKDHALWTDVARFRRSVGDLAGALKAADQAVRIRPNHVPAIILRGELTRNQYGLRAALPWFDRAIEIDPKNVTARLEKAATLGDIGEMREMLKETREVLSISSNNPIAYYLQAMLAARARKFDLARSLYQRTRGTVDDQPSGMLLASAIDYQTGNVQQAIGRLERLLTTQPNNVKARRLLAASYFRMGDAAATIRTIRPVADRQDADTYALSLMAKALERQGNGPESSRYAARAAQPQQRSATQLWSQPASDAQIAALKRRAEQIGDAPTQVLLIGALLSRGMSEEALSRALKLQRENPGAPDAHVLVGDARGMGGDFRGAAAEYKKAANLAFTEPVALRMIEALRRSGQREEASRTLQLFLQQNPRNMSAQLLAASWMLEAGRWGEAIRLYEGLRKRLGDRDAVMLNNLAWAYAQQGNYDRAIPLAEKAWTLDKNNPSTTDTFGWLLFKSGKNKALGLSLLEQATRRAPDDQEIRSHLEEARRG